MIIQNILFPKHEICDEPSLYFHSNRKIYVEDDNDCVIVNGGQTLIADTYFNSISIRKWVLYTIIDNLSLRLSVCGDMELRVIGAKYVANQSPILAVMIYHRHSSDDKEDVELQIPIDKSFDNIYFHITSLKDGSTFYGGCYTTNESSYVLNSRFKMAMNLCTYKREEYILSTIKKIKTELISNENNPISNNLDIYLVDNGETLDERDFENIRFFAQSDFGASGGFTRGLIEMINSNEEYDYVLFMDDDVIIDTETISRTYVFLSLLSDEYKNSILGGSFLKINKPYIQVESGGIWNGGKPIAPNKNLDLRSFYNVLKNEEINPNINYHPWFYCCMPFSKVSMDNLPLPMFMKRDDIEYCLRFGGNFIQLNGICVWHEGYEFKYNASLLYYIVRSTPIVNAIHKIEYTGEQYKKLVRGAFLNAVFSYSYSLANIILNAAEDFCGGVQRMKEIKEPENFDSLLSKCYKKRPIEELEVMFSKSKYDESLRSIAKPLSGWRKLTLNGALLPSSKKIVFVPENNSVYNRTYRVKVLYQYDEFQNKAVISKKSVGSTIFAFVRLRKIERLIDKKYSITVKDFSRNYREITGIYFWKKYLNLDD